MVKNNNILACFLICFMFFSFVSCSAKKTDFPVGINGYPRNDVILINGVEYSIVGSYNTDHESTPEPTVIEIERCDKIKIIIADHDFYPYDWCIEETKGIISTTYTDSYSENKSDDMLYGASSGVRIFEIIVEEDAKEIILTHKVYSLNEEGNWTKEDFLAICEQVVIKLLN